MDPEPKPAEEKPAEEPAVDEEGTVPPLLEEPSQPEQPAIPQAPDEKINDLLQRANAKRKQKREEKLRRIVKLAEKKSPINNQDIRDLLQVSQSTASNYVSELVKSGKLKMQKKARATVYSIEKFL